MSEIEEVLHQQVVGRIGCHSRDMTYVVPISYAYDGNYVYCHTREGLKVEIMRENPQVCFEVDHLHNMANWKSVIAWGEYQELTDPIERDIALARLQERVLPMITSETTHLTTDWPFSSYGANAVEGIIFRIRLERKTGRFEKAHVQAFYAS